MEVLGSMSYDDYALEYIDGMCLIDECDDAYYEEYDYSPDIYDLIWYSYCTSIASAVDKEVSLLKEAISLKYVNREDVARCAELLLHIEEQVEEARKEKERTSNPIFATNVKQKENGEYYIVETLYDRR